MPKPRFPLPDAHLICTAGLLSAQKAVPRSFRLHQQFVLQARADLFTVFNHPKSEGRSTTLPRYSSANQHRCSERRSARAVQPSIKSGRVPLQVAMQLIF